MPSIPWRCSGRVGSNSVAVFLRSGGRDRQGHRVGARPPEASWLQLAIAALPPLGDNGATSRPASVCCCAVVCVADAGAGSEARGAQDPTARPKETLASIRPGCWSPCTTCRANTPTPRSPPLDRRPRRTATRGRSTPVASASRSMSTRTTATWISMATNPGIHREGCGRAPPATMPRSPRGPLLRMARPGSWRPC
jgi:hypothetical protein